VSRGKIDAPFPATAFRRGGDAPGEVDGGEATSGFLPSSRPTNVRTPQVPTLEAVSYARDLPYDGYSL